MPIFLLDTDTFKKSFLSGAGKLEVKSDPTLLVSLIAANGRFLPTNARIADVDFSLNEGQNFRFGKSDGLKLSIGGGTRHRIHLIWPGQDNPVLKAHGLTELLDVDKLCVHLLLDARGEFSADARVPLGPIPTAFSAGVGGEVGYQRLKIYDPEERADKILADLFAGMRLPQQINSVAEIPEPGEVLVMRFGGYLKLHAGMTWGYSLTGSQSFKANELKLDLDYSLKMMAAVSIGYRMAGDFSLEARRGAKSKWVRFIVRKSRESSFNLSADFGVVEEHQLTGLPATVDDFLIKLFGADAKTVLNYFKQAREFKTLDELEKAVGSLVKGAVHDLAQNWIGQALTSQTLPEFLTKAGKIADQYNQIGDVDQWILETYHSYLDKIPRLRQTLNLLAGVTDPAAMADLINDEDETNAAKSSDAWIVTQLIWTGSVYPLLLQKEEFAKFSARVNQLRTFVEDGAMKPVRDAIAKLNEAVPLNAIFEKLMLVKSPNDLKNLADEKLQDVAGRLIGRTFAEIKKDKKFDDAFKEFQKSLSRIEDFKKNWYAKLQHAVNQSFKFDLHYAYSRAEKDAALLDLELNLSNETARQLAGQAATGDFAEILNKFHRSSFVKINRGVFTHELTESARIQINVLGWGYDSLKQLTQKIEHTVESTSSGLLHVYGTETMATERRKKGGKFKEMVESNFLLRTVGETVRNEASPTTLIDPKTRRYLIQTLQNISVQYDLMESDENTRPDELTRYLEMAVFLGLMSSDEIAALVGKLSKQFPGGLGNVQIKYVVRYDEQALRSAFGALAGEQLRNLARKTMRQVIASKFTGMRQVDWAARVGFAYLADNLDDITRDEGCQALRKMKAVEIPSWFSGRKKEFVNLSSANVEVLVTLCNLERVYVDRLDRLDRVLDKALIDKKPISNDELAEASKKFVELSNKINVFKENAFFAIFDKLVQAGAPNRARRESAMVLEITPVGKTEEEKITKILMAGK